MQKMHVRTFAFLLLVALPFAGACGGGDSDPNPQPDPGNCAAPTVDVSGVWSVSETNTVSSSTPVGYCLNDTDSYDLTFTQDASGNVTATDSDGGSYTGKVCGNQLIANTPFSYPEDGGTTTITSLTITVSGNTATATGTWTWTDGAGNCSGTSNATATR